MSKGSDAVTLPGTPVIPTVDTLQVQLSLCWNGDCGTAHVCLGVYTCVHAVMMVQAQMRPHASPGRALLKMPWNKHTGSGKKNAWTKVRPPLLSLGRVCVLSRYYSQVPGFWGKYLLQKWSLDQKRFGVRVCLVSSCCCQC